MSPPNAAPQPAATQDRSDEEPPKDTRNEQDEEVKASAATVVEGAEDLKKPSSTHDTSGPAGQPAEAQGEALAGDGAGAGAGAGAGKTQSVEEEPPATEDSGPKQGSEEAERLQELSSAELVEQLTAKTQEMALESSATPRAPTPTPTPTPACIMRLR